MVGHNYHFHTPLLPVLYSLQIADKQDKIAEEKDKRKGSVPMSVYHNIEQCLREAEVKLPNFTKLSLSLYAFIMF